LINTEWLPLLDQNPNVDEAVEFPRRELRGAVGLLRIAPWARSLRERVKPDLILDYQGLLRTALISRLCRRDGARVVGLSDAREGSRLFYDEVVDTSDCAHAVDRYLALTRSAAGAAADTTNVKWDLPEGERPRDFSAETFVILHPFSRGAGKSLVPDEVAEFCRALAPRRVVIVGRTSESLPPTTNAVDLLNKTTLLELMWLLRRASFIVSVDSGPMHIAAALTHRLVSIHTWSDPRKVGPYRAEAWIWNGTSLYTQGDCDNPAGWQEVANVPTLAEFVKTQL
jgi:ADP-heptose:LPS heptosyltransferase